VIYHEYELFYQKTKKKNSDEKEVLIDLLTFLIPDHSVYSPNVVYFG